MTEDAPTQAPPPTAASRARVAAIAVAVIALVGFVVGVAYVSKAGSEPAARAFCDAVRSTQISDARTLAMPELRPFLDDDASTRLRDEPQTRALVALRTAPAIDLDFQTAGFGDGFAPFACYAIAIAPEMRIWIVLRKKSGTWQVADLRGDPMPSSCESD